MKRTYFRLLGAFVGFAAFLFGPFPALAQVTPNLGTAAPFTVLGTNAIPTVGTVTCSDTGPGTAINGDVGSTFNSITNTGCTITGAIVAPVAASVVADFNAAYGAIDAANPCTGVIPIVTTTLAPGVYCSAAATTIPAGVILTLNGSASDVWVFRVGTGGLGALTLTSAQVVMGGAAQACNVYWKTAQAATLTDSSFVGTVLSGTAVTMTRGSWFGRALATTDATITDAAPLTFAGCAAPASITVNKDFIPNNVLPVPVALTCTSGTVITTPLNAAEGAPAVFTVGGANLTGTTCTATETVPAGYTANQANCVGVALNGSCTITNTLIAAPPPKTLTLRKTWAVNSIAGNTVTVTSAGFVNNASSGLSTATSAGNTTTGVSVTVSAGETGTIGEVFGVGAAANYTATLACTGNANALVANSLTVNAADVNIVCTETNTLIPCPVITVGPASLPSATVGATYGPVAMTATGGKAPYSFVVTSGTLPPGFTLSTGGVLSGVLTSAGSFSFTVTVTDANGCQAVQNYMLGGGFSAVGGPTLDSLGLTILVLLLAVAGAFMVNRFSL